MAVLDWLEKKAAVRVTQKPTFNTLEKIIIAVAVGIFMGSIKFGGVVLSTATIVGFGTVFGAAIVMYKFKFISLIVLAGGRWFDLGLFICGFFIGGSAFGIMAAIYAGIFFSAYLAINRYFSERKIWRMQHGK